MTLFDNAIESIQVGVEDFNHDDERRLASAVRNIHAGILLLCKEKLRQLSPDDGLLLYQRYVPRPTAGGKPEIVPVEKNTVDVQQIKERFAAFGIPFNWKPLDDINKIRNQIEHSHLQEPRDAAREVLSKAHVVIALLLEEVLEHEPVGALGKECCGVLLENAEVFERQLKICQDSLAAAPWRTKAARKALPSLTCYHCNSSLVRQREFVVRPPGYGELYCAACGEDLEIHELMVTALDEVFAGANHASIIDGGEAVIDECPDCGSEAYIVDESTCAVCDFTVPEDARCSVCGQGLTPEDYLDYDGLCGYHFHLMQKDD